MGGWMKSTNKGPSVYFTYCGGMRASNRIYLDVRSGETSSESTYQTQDIAEFIQPEQKSSTNTNLELDEQAAIPIQEAPAADTDFGALISDSDDLDRHKQVFLNGAERLISSGRCTTSDFQNSGGWKRTRRRSRTMYEVHCPEGNPIYLYAPTGATF
jgi:hypothetical protein